jgi:hypothetical protein
MIAAGVTFHAGEASPAHWPAITASDVRKHAPVSCGFVHALIG